MKTRKDVVEPPVKAHLEVRGKDYFFFIVVDCRHQPNSQGPCPCYLKPFLWLIIANYKEIVKTLEHKTEGRGTRLLEIIAIIKSG